MEKIEENYPKAFRIEFTGKLDGRAGMGDVEELIPNEELKINLSGESLDRSSAPLDNTKR